jgi:hypothetical protein
MKRKIRDLKYEWEIIRNRILESREFDIILNIN